MTLLSRKSPINMSLVEKEEWRSVEAFPDYLVSSQGRVKREVRAKTRKAGSLVKGASIKGGYIQVSIRKDGAQKTVFVHTLVCTAFHGPRPTLKHGVAHGDGVPSNNFWRNLRWATALENAQDKIHHGTVACGEKQGASKLTSNDVLKIRSDVRPQRAIAAEYGISQANVSWIKRGLSWRHIL